MKLKIRQFKGLYTNVDPADKDLEFFEKFKNIKVEEGYIESKGLKFTQIGLPNSEPVEWLDKNEDLLYQDFIYLDEDQLKNKVVDKNLYPDYVQNIRQYSLRITFNDGQILIYVRDILSQEPYKLIKTFRGSSQYPVVYNDKGIVKIFFKERSLWLGKLNRYIWLNNNPIRIGLGEIICENLYEEYSVASSPFDVLIREKDTTTDKIIDSYSRIKNLKASWLYEGNEYQCVRVIFCYSKNEENIIRLPDFGGKATGANGAFILLMVRWIDEHNRENLSYGFSFRAYAHLFDKTIYDAWNASKKTLHEFMSGVGGHGYGFLMTDLSQGGSLDREPFIWFRTEQEIKDFFGFAPLWSELRRINTGAFILSLSEEEFFSPDVKIEYAVTSLVDGVERLKSYKKIDLTSTSKPFVLEVSLSSSTLNIVPKRKEAYTLYLRITDITQDEAVADFEQVYTYNLLSDEVFYVSLVTKLSPNGIMLVQTIGKAFSPDTYQAITAFDDYVEVTGVPYALKNNNVYYPAVGNGMITDNFYKENTIRGVEGKALTSFGNLLGVFSQFKELMTLIDFNPVEDQMLFYIKGTQAYKVNNVMDIIETTEGTILHLREGIYITNSNQRTLISEPINDLVEIHFPKGRIFYSEYHKHLYYANPVGIFLFDFRTKTWSEFSHPFGSMYDFDFIEDEEGRIILYTEKQIYRLSFIEAEGELEISLIDLHEYSMAKRLNSVAVDGIGEVKAVSMGAELNKKVGELSSRSKRYLYNSLHNRKPYKDVSVGLKFSGKIYGVELDLDVYSDEQL